MKNLGKIYTLLALLLLPVPLLAQIDDIYEEPVANERIEHIRSIKGATVKSHYVSEARERAEYLARRKERNTLSVSGGIQSSSTTLNEAWVETSGGDNTIAFLGSFDFEHIFTNGNFSITSKATARFGYNRIVVEQSETLEDGTVVTEGVPIWFKYQDEFNLSSAPSIKLSNIWSYGATVTFRSQFASGYVSRTQQERIHLKSTFLAPGYLDISGGMIYSLPNEKWPVKFTFSPLAMSATYVNNEVVRQNTIYQFLEHVEGNYKYAEPYGVSPYVSSRYEGGSAIQIDLSRHLDKYKIVQYTTSLYSFYGWITQMSAENSYGSYSDYTSALEEWTANPSTVKPILSVHPTLRWENTVKINATKLLATTINYRVYYNRSQNLGVQMQTLVNVGIVYTFKNK